MTVEWGASLGLLIGLLLVLMAFGLPIAFAFFTVNLVGAVVFLGGEAGIEQAIRNAQASVTQYALAPIPLFVLMGELLFRTGLAARAIDAVERLMARVPGRLSLVAIAGGTVFSALTGSTIANTAVLGSTLLPEMYRRGYQPQIAIGPIMAVGGLAMLIPPSGLGVLLGSLAKVSINKVLIGGIIPGLLLGFAFFAYVVIRCSLQPDIAPSYPVERIRGWQRIRPFVVHVVPLFSIFIVVVGSMLAGIATPTESAALGVVAVLIVALAYRRLTLSALMESVDATFRLSCMLLFVAAASLTFSQVLAFSGGASGLAGVVTGWGLTPTMVVLCMVGLLLVLGCFMDPVSMMMITLPLFLPIIQSSGVDPVWFSILMLLALEISLITPPFGMLLFVMQGVAPSGTTLRQIYSSVTPFFLLEIFVLGMVVLIPGLATWLPSLGG